jgi:hypothetical protein
MPFICEPNNLSNHCLCLLVRALGNDDADDENTTPITQRYS